MNKIALFMMVGAILFMGSCRSTRSAPLKKKAEEQKLEKRLGIEIPGSYDPKLLNCIAGWMGTPYKYGGETSRGTDCSGMVRSVYVEVYGLKLERNAGSQKDLSRKISEKKLREGDLVFFSINSKKTDHVGIYLWEGYFIHASTKKGVIINNLSEPYYRKAFSGAGSYRK